MRYIKPFLLFLAIAIAVLASVQVVYGFTSGIKRPSNFSAENYHTQSKQQLELKNSANVYY